MCYGGSVAVYQYAVQSASMKCSIILVVPHTHDIIWYIIVRLCIANAGHGYSCSILPVCIYCTAEHRAYTFVLLACAFLRHTYTPCVCVCSIELGQTIGVYVIGRDVARRSPPATRAPVPQKVIPSRYMNVWTMQALK